jgi:hypothetical protein
MAMVAGVVLASVAGAALIAAAKLKSDDGAGARSSVVGLSANGVYPVLAPPGDIGAAGAGARDSGAGVYPALTAADRLLVPGPRELRAATRWLSTRQGRTAYAVADERGALSGVRTDERFQSASLSKAMILVAFLRHLEATRAQPSPAELLSLGYMIRISDNGSTNAIFRRVGGDRMRELARAARMQDFHIAGDWANATVTAADQARFFMSLDRLVPARFLPLAHNLLETIIPPHSWGIPRAARPRWRTFFKGGWRPEAGAEVVHQAALLESGPRRLGLAIMTSGDPTKPYGEKTIEGVTRRLLGASPEPFTLPVGAPPEPGELSPLPQIDRARVPDPPALGPLNATGK